MAHDESHRRELFDALDAALGPRPAATLMAHLPPVGWADVATKHDLAELERRIDLRFEAVDRRFEAVDQRFAALDQSLDHRFKAMEHQFEGLAHRVDGTVQGLAAKLHTEMAAQAKAWFFGVVGVTFTTAGLAFAAARLGGG